MCLTLSFSDACFFTLGLRFRLQAALAKRIRTEPRGAARAEQNTWKQRGFQGGSRTGRYLPLVLTLPQAHSTHCRGRCGWGWLPTTSTTQLPDMRQHRVIATHQRGALQHCRRTAPVEATPNKTVGSWTGAGSTTPVALERTVCPYQQRESFDSLIANKEWAKTNGFRRTRGAIQAARGRDLVDACARAMAVSLMLSYRPVVVLLLRADGTATADQSSKAVGHRCETCSARRQVGGRSGVTETVPQTAEAITTC
jgi:hypothetical protein